MKSRLLSILALLAAFTCSRAETDAPPSGPKLVQSYKDVLAVIPDEFSPARASQWTELKKSAVNVILKENIVDPHTRAKFHATVSQVAHWPDLTLFWEVPNSEGYHIRVFAHFTDDWKARLSMLNTGDPVTIEGTFFEAKFRDLWGNSTLSLCLGGSTFTKEATATGQTQAAPAVRKTTADSEEAVAPAVPRDRGHFDSPAMKIDPTVSEKTKATLVLSPVHGVLTFARAEDLPGTHGFTFSPGEISVGDLSSSVKEGFSKDLITLGWSQTESGGYLDMPRRFPATLVRGATFEMMSENAVRIVLRMDEEVFE